MPGSDGLVSCVGGCNSKLFNSRRVHRPLVDNNSQKTIHLLPESHSKPFISRYPNSKEVVHLPPVQIFSAVPNVKKSRKRRDRKASGASQEANITVRHHDSDDDEETPKRSRPLAVRFTFWVCGILIVVLGAGALVYSIYLASTSMDKLTKAINTQTTETKLMRKFSGKRLEKTGGNLAAWDTTFPP